MFLEHIFQEIFNKMCIFNVKVIPFDSTQFCSVYFVLQTDKKVKNRPLLFPLMESQAITYLKNILFVQQQVRILTVLHSGCLFKSISIDQYPTLIILSIEIESFFRTE